MYTLKTPSLKFNSKFITEKNKTKQIKKCTKK